MRRRICMFYVIAICLINYSCRDTIHKEYYPNGQLKEVGKLVDGIRQGQWILFTNKGDTAEISFYRNDTLLEQKTYINNNMYLKKEFSEGKKYLLTVYNANGLIESTHQMSGNKSDGETISYYPNGNVMSIANYSDDQIIGEFKQFYDDGTLNIYSKNVGNGIHQIYDSSGKLKFEVLYEDFLIVDTVNFLNGNLNP